jgi:hypothetical protein
MTAPRPIVIVGLPRSGTTWTLRAMGSAVGEGGILEPDNEDKVPAAIHAKHGLGRYPVLQPGDDAAPYRRLWEWVFNGAVEGRRSNLARHLLGPGAAERIHEGRPDPVTWLAATIARNPNVGPVRVDGNEGPRIVAKSIHAQLAVEWLADEFDLEVVLLLRHPANVLASWMEVHLKDARNSTLESRPEIRSRYLEPWGIPPPGPDPVERMSWRIALLTAAIEDVHARHPEFQLRTHEQLCTDPPAEFSQLFDDVGLPWGEASETFLKDHNVPGTGFAVRRVASDLSDSWQQRLDDAQVSTLRRVLEWFPISTWTDADFERR